MSFLDKVLQKLFDDGIHSKGTTDGWEWIKYTDGRSECRKEGETTGIYLYERFGAHNYRATIEFPLGMFTEPPTAMGKGTLGSGTGWITYSPADTNGVTITIAGSENSSRMRYAIEAKGKWK